MPTGVDSSAPVLAHHEIDVRADLETVWRLLTEVNAWPQWQTDITQAHLPGALQVGESFTWTNPSYTGTCTLYTVVDHCQLVWGGTSDGITGVQEWVFSAMAGQVHVCTRESFSGAGVADDPARVQSILDASLAFWLSQLKTTAEAR